MNKNIEQSDNMRIRSEIEERNNYCDLHIKQYFARLDNLYNRGMLTEYQYVEWRRKINSLPLNIEDRLKYLQGLLEDLGNVYLKKQDDANQ